MDALNSPRIIYLVAMSNQQICPGSGILGYDRLDAREQPLMHAVI